MRILKYFLTIMLACLIAGTSDACYVYERIKKTVKRHPVATLVITTLGAAAGYKFLTQQYTAYCERVEKEQQEIKEKKFANIITQFQAVRNRRTIEIARLKAEIEKINIQEAQREKKEEIIAAVKKMFEDYEQRRRFVKQQIHQAHLQEARDLRTQGFMATIAEEGSDAEHAEGPIE